jgi:trigger factor
MKTEVKKLPRGQVELTIELTIEEYQPFLETAAKTISEHIKIPGFRPGKAALDVVKQKVGEGQIWQEAMEGAIQKTFLKALNEQKLVTIGSPHIDIVKLAPGNPVIYKAIINLFPDVKLTDYLKIKVSKKPITVKEEKVKETMSNLQKMRANEILVNRKSQKGDKVEIDFETFLDKIPIDHGKQQNFPIIIGEGNFIPGFEEQIIDLAKDETKEFELEFPKNYHQKNLAGRIANFKVKINAVYEVKLPKLDDEFAKGLGNFKNLKELENQIKDNLGKEAQDKEDHRLEEEMIEKIVSQSEFDEIPDILVNSETKKMIEELEYNISQQGLKFEDYLVHLKKTKDDLLLDFVPTAIKRVKGALVSRKVAEIEKISASDQEAEVEIKNILESYPGNEQAKKQINTPSYKNYLKNVIASKKVIDHLKSKMVE